MGLLAPGRPLIRLVLPRQAPRPRMGQRGRRRVSPDELVTTPTIVIADTALRWRRFAGGTVVPGRTSARRANLRHPANGHAWRWWDGAAHVLRFGGILGLLVP